MLRLFDGEMKYTYFKIVHGSVYNRKSSTVIYAHFLVLRNLEAQENKTNCLPQEQTS